MRLRIQRPSFLAYRQTDISLEMMPGGIHVFTGGLELLTEETEKLLLEREATLLAEYKEALVFAGFGAGDRVLDIATGSGRMLQQLLAAGCDVVSGDISEEALSRARERLGELAGRAELVVMDARHMPFDEGSFTAVTLANAIHEIENPAAVLEQIPPVLTACGKLLVVEFNHYGFDLMDLHHKALDRGIHSRGEMSATDIDHKLRAIFPVVSRLELGMNHVWMAARE